MMKFRTSYDPVPSVPSNPGERFHVTHKLIVDQDGTYDLKVSGKVDTYSEIQSWRESCDLKVLLQRYANGDTNALNRKQLLYGDFTTMPKTLAEYQQMQVNVEQAFDSLPAEQRSKFGNSSSRFVASFGSPEFFEALGVKLPSAPVETPVETPVESPVVKEEVVNE